MESKDSQLRSVLVPGRRRMLALVAAGGVATAGVFAAGVLVGATLHHAPAVTHISTPAPQVRVEVPVQPPPLVTIEAPPTPATLASEPSPAPPPQQPPPRANAPTLWAGCVTLSANVEPTDRCTWDDGFPAISADGSTMAIRHVPDDGGRGYPGLSIRILDARTGAIVRTHLVLDPDEYIEDVGENDTAVVKLRAKVGARVASVQKQLDTGGYRSLAYLGGTSSLDRDGIPGDTVATSAVLAEVDAGAARIVDTTTNTVIWQGEIGVARPGPPPSPDDECDGWERYSTDLWWDPQTRVLLASHGYHTGGCMCGSGLVEQVIQLPRD